MAILAIIFVLFASIAIAAMFGCWWYVQATSIVGGLALIWWGAGAVVRSLPTRRQASAWWRRNRRALTVRALVAGIIVAALATLWCLGDKIPQCDGGCWSRPATVVTPTTTTTTMSSSTEERIEAGLGWSALVCGPVGGGVKWLADDVSARYFVLVMGVGEFSYPITHGSDKFTPDGSCVRFRSGEPHTVGIRVTKWTKPVH